MAVLDVHILVCLTIEYRIVISGLHDVNTHMKLPDFVFLLSIGVGKIAYGIDLYARHRLLLDNNPIVFDEGFAFLIVNATFHI